MVEDNDDARETLRIVLEYRGALVTAAASAGEAKRILTELQPYMPDVRVSDISLPEPKDSMNSWRSRSTRSRCAV